MVVKGNSRPVASELSACSAFDCSVSTFFFHSRLQECQSMRTWSLGPIKVKLPGLCRKVKIVTVKVFQDWTGMWMCTLVCMIKWSKCLNPLKFLFWPFLSLPLKFLFWPFLPLQGRPAFMLSCVCLLVCVHLCVIELFALKSKDLKSEEDLREIFVLAFYCMPWRLDLMQSCTQLLFACHHKQIFLFLFSAGPKPDCGTFGSNSRLY